VISTRPGPGPMVCDDGNESLLDENGLPKFLNEHSDDGCALRSVHISSSESDQHRKRAGNDLTQDNGIDCKISKSEKH